MSGFMYNGIHSSNHNMNVLRVRRGVLPPIASRILEVPGRMGGYYQGRQFGVRTITVDVQVTATDASELRDRIRALAAWLQPGREPKPLVFDDEPNLTWMAVLSGDTDLEEIVAVGKGTLTFLCPDLVALGQEVTVSLGTSGGTVTPGGTAPAWPVIKATVQQPITHLVVATPDKYILLGRPVAAEETPVDRYQTILMDELTSTTGWTTGDIVENGVVDGEMVSDGNRFVVQDYGSGSKWHGPALKKGLPETLQDFRVTVRLTVINSTTRFGRGDVYLLDANGAVIGQMSIRDHWAAYYNMWAELRAGPLEPGGVSIIDEHGSKAGVWNRFDGIVQLTRIGQNWYAYVAMVDTKTGRHHTRAWRQFYDKDSQYQTPLAQVQLHAGAYGTYEPCEVSFDWVKVEKINTVQTAEVPYIAYAGDVIEIDCERHGIFLNGEPRMDLLDPGSQFFSLSPGETVAIGVTPEGVADLELTYRERWL